MLRARLLIILFLFLGAAPALSQESPPPPPHAQVSITSRPGQDDDAYIAKRISEIFAQIDGLDTIKVAVSAGVVRLEGSVANQQQAERATAIAERVAGVTAVQNNLDRNVEVKASVVPALDKFRQDMLGLVRTLPLIGVALLIGGVVAVFGYWLAGRRTIWSWVTPNVFLAELVASTVRVVSLILGAVVALEIIGATALLGAVLGGAGVIGIALGFAVRDTVDNYVSSLMLSLRQPFRANDHIVIDSREGRVVRLTSRATILMTLDGNHLRMPNSIVFKSIILNYTRNPERRFDFDLGIDADDDALEGMAVGLSALRGLDFVLATPEPTAFIQNVGDSNLVLRFYGWVDQRETDFLKGRSLSIQAAKSALEAAGLTLPEPIYRLRFDSAVPVEKSVADQPDPSTLRTPAGVTAPGPYDTAPTPDIERMVREERAETPGDDLLDDRKPIE